ncbi:hypothetical protein ACQ3WT_005109, partial [Escherichia coli]
PSVLIPELTEQVHPLRSLPPYFFHKPDQTGTPPQDTVQSTGHHNAQPAGVLFSGTGTIPAMEHY